MATTMRRFFSLGVLVMVLALLAGPAGAAAQRAQAPVTIRVSTWDTGTDGLKPYQEGIRAFEAMHPNIKVDIESITNPMNHAATAAGPHVLHPDPPLADRVRALRLGPDALLAGTQLHPVEPLESPGPDRGGELRPHGE